MNLSITRTTTLLLALAAAAPAAAHAGECTAELFGPGLFSSEKEEWRITFSPDGRTALWTVSDDFFPISRQSTIVMSRFVNGAWTQPQIAPFSGDFPDIDPAFSPSGHALYFSSIRPVDGEPRADLDIWVVFRLPGDRWSEPVHLGDDVNSPFDELYPSVDWLGTVYFGSDRPGGLGGWDIYRARRTWFGYRPAENLGAPVNSEYWEFNPEITPSGLTLFFASIDRPGGFGLGDIYVAHAEWGGGFGAPRNLGPCVNSALDEYHPTLSRDRRSLFFVRHSYEPWVPGDFYRVRLH